MDIFMRKKLLLLCILFTLSTSTMPVTAEVYEPVTTWDCIWFGNYPNTAVSDTTNIKVKYYYVRNDEGQVIGIKNSKNFKDGEELYYYRDLYSSQKYLFYNSCNSCQFFTYEPIKWRILKKYGNKTLLLSDKIIDQHFVYQPSFKDGSIVYFGDKIDFTWRNSQLRKYMNNDIYNLAFSDEEKSAILESNVTSDFSYKDAQDVTVDKLFILSYAQYTEQYGFTSNQSLLCELSDFGKYSGTKDVTSYGKYSSYFTLTSGTKSENIYEGDNSSFAFCDAFNNVIDSTGSLISENALSFNGIRVAMWVDLSKCKYQNAGTVSSDGSVNEIAYKIAPPSRADIKKIYAKKKQSKKITMKLKTILPAKGYQIAVYTAKQNAKNNKKAIVKKFADNNTTATNVIAKQHLKDNINVTITSKKFKNKKTLFVKVRAYRVKDAKKIYGSWSKIKKVRISKSK